MHQFEERERRREEGEIKNEDSDDDEDAKASRKLEVGAYTQQRLAVVMVVTAAHSSAVARRVDEKLHQVISCKSISQYLRGLLTPCLWQKTHVRF